MRLSSARTGLCDEGWRAQSVHGSVGSAHDARRMVEGAVAVQSSTSPRSTLSTRSFVGLEAYDASKGGMLMFTKSLALELAPHGIRVMAIAPVGSIPKVRVARRIQP